MANTSNNGNFTDAELDMARIYGVNDPADADGSERNLENLAGYNVNEPEANAQSDNRANADNRTAEVDRTLPNNGDINNTTQREDLEVRNNTTQQIEQRNDQMIPAPHRQEQTLPTGRPSQDSESSNDAENSLSLEHHLHEVSDKNMDAFLRTQIGRNVRMQFLIGTDTLIEKSGVLLAVGNNFVVLREPESGEVVVCDFGGTKFVNFEGAEAR